MGMLRDLGKRLSKLGSVAYEEAKEKTLEGKVWLEIQGVQRNIDKAYRDLGERVYHLISEEVSLDVYRDPQVRGFISWVRFLEEELQLKGEELEQIKEEKE